MRAYTLIFFSLLALLGLYLEVFQVTPTDPTEVTLLHWNGEKLTLSPEYHYDIEKLRVPADLTPLLFLPVPINSATKEALITIPGIGPKLAQLIIEHRVKHGPYTHLEDLLAVKGIGRKRLHKLLPNIVLR